MVCANAGLFSAQTTVPELTAKTVFVLFVFIRTAMGAGQPGEFHINYTVEVTDPETNLFHVAASVENINQARLDLSLPDWTPGWYKVENYANNLLRFRIADGAGSVGGTALSDRAECGAPRCRFV